MNIGTNHAITGKFEVEALSVVVAQIAPISAQTMEEVHTNIDTICDWMDKAAYGYPGYDLFVSPEFGSQGCGPYWQSVMVEMNGPEMQRYQTKCQELSVWGIFNFLVREYKGHKACNLAIMINDRGEIVHEYVKMFPWLPAESTYPGGECPVTPGPKGARIATIICADGDYPESWREAAYNGANIIVRVAHYMVPWDRAWDITNKAGAYCNQVYVVASNCVGMDESYSYFGKSTVLNPDGTSIIDAPIGIPWLMKADLYPQIIDKLHQEQTTNNCLWAYRRRGAAHPDFNSVGRGLGEFNAYRKE